MSAKPWNYQLAKHYLGKSDSSDWSKAMNGFFIHLFNFLFRWICKPLQFVFSNVKIFQESAVFRTVAGLKAHYVISFFFLLMMSIPDNRWKNIYFIVFVVSLLLLFVSRFPTNIDRLPGFRGMDEFFIVFHFFFFVSTCTSIFPGESLKYFIAAMMLFLMSLLILNLVKKTDLRFIVFGVAMTVLTVSLIGIYQLKTGKISVNTSYTDVTMFQGMGARMSATFGNPNIFGEFLILGIPFVLAGVLIAKGTKKLLFGLILLPAMYALLKTGSRSAWLSFAVSAFFFSLLWKPKTLLYLSAAGCFALYFMPDNIFFRIMSIFNRQDTSIATRKYIYASTINMIKNYPFGVGLGSSVYETVLENYKDKFTSAAHSHNLYLQILAEQGIVAFIVFVAMMIRLTILSVINIIKSKEEEIRIIMIAAFSSIIGIMVMGIAEHIWFYFRIQFFLWLDFTVLFLVFRENSSPEGISD